MGNVPTTVKHCLSHEQLARDYPWLKRWLVEEKVGIFAVSGLFFPVSFLHVSTRHVTIPGNARGWEGGGGGGGGVQTCEAF